MRPLVNFYLRSSEQAREFPGLISSDVPVISGGTFLDRGAYFVAVAASCGRWRVEGRESRRADTRETNEQITTSSALIAAKAVV